MGQIDEMGKAIEVRVKMKKNDYIFLLLLIVMNCMFLFTVQADTGPKPSVKITFENMSDELCYGTLLSKEASTGPASVWNGSKEDVRIQNMDYDVWKAFVNYKDSDGYYFLQEGWKCNETKKMEWIYYPPESFKILLYYPKTNRFVSSGIYERYAFDSYFIVDMSKVESGIVDAHKNIVAEKSYDYRWEILSLFCRVLITILLEIGVALLFGLNRRKQISVIILINCITQVLLNLLLNIINYHQGPKAFMLNYVLFEIIVFVIETVLYYWLFNKKSKYEVSGKKIVAYALAANMCSFVAGLLIAKWIPGIF